MITQAEYEKAKFIVHQFEEQERIQGYMDADEQLDDYWDEEDEEESEYERQAEIADACTCGAWQFNLKGIPVHIADCYCGAE